MPTIFYWRGHRFYYFSNEGFEPPHVHIDKDHKTVKFWLDPVAVARNIGFSVQEITRLTRKISEEQSNLLKVWHEHFGDKS
ncbi:MAG: DUF4160 domain-containing protein [Alphaproteobacteria bacterium]|nr:DUF4160 domain-containing protein [Alphaproteobacteria bacterium]